MDDVLRACRVALEPLAGESGEVDVEVLAGLRAALQRRLYELDGLCDPRLFPSESSFFTAHELRGKLAYFETVLESDLTGAQRHWQLELAEQLDSAQSTLGQEIRQAREDR